MTTQTTKPATVRLERTLDASAEVVFQALTDPALITRWYGPSDEYTVTADQWDCRVGGTYRLAITHSGGNVHTAVGTFREIVPGKRLAKTWMWEGQPPMDTLVTFDLTPAGTGTHLVLTHVGFPAEEVAQEHLKGWTGCLDRLTLAMAL